jgi:nicotinate phosphoribosyltransferase
LTVISKKVRRILDKHGLSNVQIFASGDLDEYKIDKLIGEGAKIDAFGVGTRMGTSYDRPYVDVVYKLAGKVEGGVFVPAMKLSKGKITFPGKKQVFRQKNRQGKYSKDIIGLEEEKIDGEPLLLKIMEKGKITHDLPTLEEIRKTALGNLADLPEEYKKLKSAARYRVELSPRLREIRKRLAKQIKAANSA